MNYYDEEIIVAGPDTKSLGAIKVDRMVSGTKGSRNNAERETKAAATAASRRTSSIRQQNVANSAVDDGLLIIDHDDDDDDDEGDTDEDSEFQEPVTSSFQQARRSATQRPLSSRFGNIPSAKIMENDSERSDTESDDGLGGTPPADAISASGATGFGFIPQKARIPSATKGTASIKKQTSTEEVSATPLNITPDKWEQLNIDDEIKELFPYILKYTPQNIDIPYRLQPFIPDFVPAVGDVDALIKVTTPPVLNAQRQRDMDEHVRKLGLYFLDEPSGEQSQPSLLNMKLRSVLTGSGVNPRLASAALIPTAKSPKDIDKWIGEVEQVHMTQSVHANHELRKDIESLLLDWPRDYATAGTAINEAYQRCLQTDITLGEFIRILSDRFGIQGPLETQVDYILNVQTLFTLYLAANQAWE